MDCPEFKTNDVFLARLTLFLFYYCAAVVVDNE